MAIRLSDAAASLVIGTTGLKGAITGGKIIFYTGSQPSSANDSIGTSQPVITIDAEGSGIAFEDPADGAPTEDKFYIAKSTSQTWKGNNGFNDSGTVFSGITSGQSYSVGWGRIIVSLGDTGADATSGTSGYVRVDFSIGTANSDCTMLPTTSLYVNTTSGSEVETVISSFKLKINKQMS